ncbi:hypothetical protein [Tsuneonella amylolytica]|uniref:hypothetical protein n=1 Tax=Tsuneonella amylolytica TaxID=2338327 RepID=UPI000EA9AEAB|nr:hypothetical protein [Tsuneonella amylolytica]
MLALALPALGGVFYLVTNGAPRSYAIANGAALAVGLAWIRFGRLPDGLGARRAFTGVLLVLLALPLLTGPHVDGVSRWLPAGPFALHSGMLAVPYLCLLTARDEHWGPLALAMAAFLSAAQPDAATALAIASAAAAIALAKREFAFVVVAALAAAAAIYSYGIGDLPPQPFVEGVIQELWADRPIQAFAAMLLLVSSAWLFLVEPQLPRAEGFALAGVLAGFVVMAMIAPYPTPLIGYGVAPILGFALAIGAVPGKRQRSTGDLLDIAWRVRP